MITMGRLDFVHGSGQTSTTSVASADVNQEPWFSHYWAPKVVYRKFIGSLALLFLTTH
ncbi:MAG: hypothetical protein J4F49_04370 [Rhodobacteraceae bacterium]|nr:hypothetical protein [Paracoccaceae bacterium]